MWWRWRRGVVAPPPRCSCAVDFRDPVRCRLGHAQLQLLHDVFSGNVCAFGPPPLNTIAGRRFMMNVQVRGQGRV